MHVVEVGIYEYFKKAMYSGRNRSKPLKMWYICNSANLSLLYTYVQLYMNDLPLVITWATQSCCLLVFCVLSKLSLLCMPLPYVCVCKCSSWPHFSSCIYILYIGVNSDTLWVLIVLLMGSENTSWKTAEVWFVCVYRHVRLYNTTNMCRQIGVIFMTGHNWLVLPNGFYPQAC